MKKGLLVIAIALLGAMNASAQEREKVAGAPGPLELTVPAGVAEQDLQKINNIVNKAFDLGAVVSGGAPGISVGGGVSVSIKSAAQGGGTAKAVNMTPYVNVSSQEAYKNFLCDAACDVAAAAAVAGCSGLSAGAAVAACIAAAGAVRDECHRRC